MITGAVIAGLLYLKTLKGKPHCMEVLYREPYGAEITAGIGSKDTAPECVQYTPQVCVKGEMRYGAARLRCANQGGTTFLTSRVR